MIRLLTGLAMILMSITDASAGGVLVFGGTGQLGAPHVRMLLEQGEQVTVFHRASSTFDRLSGLSYTRAKGDLMDADSVLAAIQQAKPRIVIDTSARRGRQMGDGEQHFYANAMRNIVVAAKSAGVEQIIIHSSIGVRGSAAEVLAGLGYNANSPNLLDKAKAEEILEQSGIPYTIMRNGLLEHEPAPATGRGHLSEDRASFGRITRTDLARLALGCIDNRECVGKVYHAIDAGLSGPRPSREEEEDD